ncbi:hypothetical protein ACYSNX_07290 [Myroides sp. LJL115]
MSNILFVFEGEKTEDQIVTSFTKHVFRDKSVITCAYCAEIYQLHKELKGDKDLDTFSLLKKIPQNKEILKGFNRDDFAEIYLFFDYDGHSTLACDSALFEMLKIFNEETDLGRLYISYPMVESIKHFSETLDFKTLQVEAKQNIKYKKIVADQCDSIYQQFSKYTFDIWKLLLTSHLNKMNYIITDSYTLPEKSITQDIIFHHQKVKYIDINSKVSVLSAFPVFMFDYFGATKFLKIIS